MLNASAEYKYLYAKTVKGRDYLYFRRPTDNKLIALPRPIGSAEFRRAHAACMKAFAAADPLDELIESSARSERKPFAPDTFGAAGNVYLASLAFEKLKPKSKNVYSCALDVMIGYLGDTKLSDLDLDAVDIYSEMVTRKHSASTADRHVYLLSSVWTVCRKHAQFGLKGMTNPTTGAEKRYTPKAPHMPWSDDAEERFMQTAPFRLRLAKLLLHFSAQRGGDCVKLLWSAFDGEGITVKPEKTDRRVADPEPNYHLCPKPLRDALVSAPREGATILTNAWGQPYANATTLSHAIRNHLIKIGLAARGTKTITMHGLRKNAAADVASLGVGAAGIKSVTGQATDKMANYYAAQHDRRAVNAKVVEAWDAKLAADAAAAPARRRAQIRRVK